jgi:hypothetical protein
LSWHRLLFSVHGGPTSSCAQPRPPSLPHRTWRTCGYSMTVVDCNDWHRPRIVEK